MRPNSAESLEARFRRRARLGFGHLAVVVSARSMTPHVALRPMRPDELATFRATFIEAWAADLAQVEDLTMDAARAQAAQRTGADLEGALESGHHHLFVVTAADEAVGTLWFSVREGRAFVEDITIAEPHRGHGHGHRALELMHEVLHRMGVRVVQLNVYTHNPRARALYERLGYEVTGYTMTLRPPK